MKVLSVLIALFSFWLTGMPCCSVENSCDTTEVNPESVFGSEEDCEDHLPCSPFYSCGTCTGFSTEKFSFTILPISEEIKSEPIHFWKALISEQHSMRIVKPPGDPISLLA
ncbi:hypothetical protein JYB62_09555 [Algoriphagus lutimaris]|uniref:hypothetical protein n=1 Tax=Algoriphagus lutimaris TaxID=613197 RepID=UPI00196A8863|nr:hypothetical protein [Algoriphagus lutimaris]MBN3520248.1 hypothetical protein [Algoriphagus lutimaris]